MIDTSDDGEKWWQERHPVHGSSRSGGIETARTAQELAERVLARRFTALRGDRAYDWEDLWFRLTVWDHLREADERGMDGRPHPPGKADIAPEIYGHYLGLHHAQPEVIRVFPPRQARDAVWRVPVGTGSGITGGVPRAELDELLTELAMEVQQARECGYDSDPAGERAVLDIARGLVAGLDLRLADRVAELDSELAHRPRSGGDR